jgi:putative transposase
MPWKTKDEQEQRYELVRAMRAGVAPVSELCRRFRIARRTAYKWRRRYRQGRLRGLLSRSRRPKEVTGRTSELWLGRLKRFRKKRPSWGARKLAHRLAEHFGRAGVPSVASCSRWLRRWGYAKGKRRRLAGPTVLRERVKPARHCNDVWTVDFKGWYRTGDGTRVDPLTVRDLYSRYGLRVVLLEDQSVAVTQRAFARIFKRYGLPKRIRSDNGTPFGAVGPTGLTRLSAWWTKLGIKVEFITPGRPCENGAHEQFHRVYKAEVAREPAEDRGGQQRRSDRWLRYYNWERPHEALGMDTPAKRYRGSRRQLPQKLEPWTYPARWQRRWVKGNGEINWKGKRRFVGEAFVKDYVGLKPNGNESWLVYFGPILIGELHEKERGNIRPAKYRHKKRRR